MFPEDVRVAVLCNGGELLVVKHGITGGAECQQISEGYGSR